MRTFEQKLTVGKIFDCSDELGISILCIVGLVSIVAGAANILLLPPSPELLLPLRFVFEHKEEY